MGTRDGKSHFRNATPEIVPDRNEHECDQKKIERIERPTQKTGNKSIALPAIKGLEQTKRLHVPLYRRIVSSLVQPCWRSRGRATSDHLFNILNQVLVGTGAEEVQTLKASNFGLKRIAGIA